MTAIETSVLAERTAAVERHLARVAAKLPAAEADLTAGSDATDAVILHLWQATQIVIDLAMSLCVRMHLGTPSSYADAFVKLSQAGKLEAGLADRLKRAAGFRNVIAHAYETLDLIRVYHVAKTGPADLRRFLAAAAALSPGGQDS